MTPPALLTELFPYQGSLPSLSLFPTFGPLLLLSPSPSLHPFSICPHHPGCPAPLQRLHREAGRLLPQSHTPNKQACWLPRTPHPQHLLSPRLRGPYPPAPPPTVPCSPWAVLTSDLNFLPIHPQTHTSVPQHPALLSLQITSGLSPPHPSLKFFTSTVSTSINVAYR